MYKFKKIFRRFDVDLTPKEKAVWCRWIPIMFINLLIMCSLGVLPQQRIFGASIFGYFAISALMVPGTEKLGLEIKRFLIQIKCLIKAVVLSKTEGKFVQVLKTDKGDVLVCGDIEAFSSMYSKKRKRKESK